MAAASSRLGLLVPLVAGALAAACIAAADTGGTTIVSSHWAGYVATRLTAAPSVFTSATGTWKQPRASCMRDSQGSATAIWVGIGGYDGRMQALQQVGSTAGCDRRGRQTNTVWFAVLPHPALPIPLKVRPGDILTGVVTVLPTATRLRLVNRTRGWVFERTIAAGLPDTASAEWIVEPPMNCRRYSCDQAQLANFGALTFTEIGLVADGQARTLATPALTVTPIELGWDPSGRNTPWATATPGPIDDPGTSFTITWHDATHIDRH